MNMSTNIAVWMMLGMLFVSTSVINSRLARIHFDLVKIQAALKEGQ